MGMGNRLIEAQDHAEQNGVELHEVDTAKIRGFGFTLDLERGSIRQWFVRADGIKRWADTDAPVTE